MSDRSELRMLQEQAREPPPAATADSPGTSPRRAVVLLALLANLPLASYAVLELMVGWSQRLWIGARDDVLVYGAAGIGPLLAGLTILLNRQRRRSGMSGSTFASWAAWLSLATGVVVAHLARGLGGPWLLWSLGLVGLMLLVVSERDPPG